MALSRQGLTSLSRVALGSLRRGGRCASTFADDSQDSIRKSVFISQSTDVFTNLALEDWLYRNNDFANHHVLLLWRNQPCVVIGRHQNPWVEANVRSLDRRDVPVARRNSGGGAVYHDIGNLNMSFFTPRKHYNRRYNLDIITRALFREWGLKTVVNQREDIVVNDEFKVSFDSVSGTAAKLGRPNAYHHCTLLVNMNKAAAIVALKKTDQGIVTNATESVRSPIKNLAELNNHVNMEKLMETIGWEYLRTKALVIEDGGEELLQRQKGFQMINPSEDWFTGIGDLTAEFRSWDWRFGKTPKFTVSQTVTLPNEKGAVHRLDLTLDVQNGLVEDIRISLPSNVASDTLQRDASVVSSLRGERYDHDVIERLVAAAGGKIIEVGNRPAQSNVAVTQ